MLGRAGTFAIIAFGFATAAMAQSSETSVEFDMPAQSLDQALRNYGVVADKQVMFSVDLVNGKTVGPIAGEMTPDEALQTLLADTGLVFETTFSDVILIRTAQQRASITGGNSLEVVQLQDAAPRQIESVDEKGDDGRSAVSEDEGSVFQQLEEIVVTGTNIRGVQNPTTPVLQFDRKDIDQSGAATVDEFLRTIPQNFNAIRPVSTGSADDFTSENTQSFGASVNLRGIGGGTTLTLLNGRRMTVSGSDSIVDVSVLPLGAIDRVEVLTDGASAVYGSDAVAGVVNFITRKDYEGFEVRGRYGTVTNGSKEDYGVGAAGGFSWSGGGGLFGIDYTDAKPLRIRELPNIDLNDPLFEDSESTVGALVERISGTVSLNQAITNRLSVAVDGLYTNREVIYIGNPARIPERELLSEQDSYFINTRLDYALTDDVTASLFYDYSREDGTRADERDGYEETNARNLLRVIEGTVSGRFMTLPSGNPLSFALGGLYREESYNTVAIPDTLERDVTSAYGELLIPIIGKENALPLVSAFDVSLAGRYEDYSDFGGTFNPKIGMHWAVNEALSFMASYSESFKAPTLFDASREPGLFTFAYPNTFFTAFPEIIADPDGQTVYLGAGGLDTKLTEETADVWSAGANYEPGFIPGLTVSTTYFMYDYVDRVGRIGVIDLFQDPAFGMFANPDPDLATVEALFALAEEEGLPFFNLANADPEDVQFVGFTGLRNISGQKVEGLDFTVDYEKDTAYGVFSASMNAAYLLTFDTQVTDMTPIVDQLNVLYRPIDLKLRGSLSWSRDGLTAFVAFNHIDGYRDNPNADIANHVSSWTTADLAFTFDFSERFENALAGGTVLSLSVSNLFNKQPPFVETTEGYNFDTSNADPYGRQISISLAKSF